MGEIAFFEGTCGRYPSNDLPLLQGKSKRRGRALGWLGAPYHTQAATRAAVLSKEANANSKALFAFSGRANLRRDDFGLLRRFRGEHRAAHGGVQLAEEFFIGRVAQKLKHL